MLATAWFGQDHSLAVGFRLAGSPAPEGDKYMIGTKSRLLMGMAMIAVALPAAAQNRNRAAQPATLAIGQSIEGEIAAPREGQCPPADPRVRSYEVTLPADTRIQVTMVAGENATLDPVVEIGKMDGCTYTMLASNDDGDGEEDGLNSRLIATVNTAGNYVIRARALNEEGLGKFTLALTTLPPVAPAPAAIPLTLGQSAQGTLTTNDAVIDDSGTAYADAYSDYAAESPSDSSITVSGTGRPYHLYTLTGTAGTEYLVKMDSEEFDAYLDAGVQSPLGFTVIASNDDGGGEEDGLNSRLRIKFQTDGTITLRASPLGNDTGSYTISADIAPPLEAAADAAAEAPHEH